MRSNLHNGLRALMFCACAALAACGGRSARPGTATVSMPKTDVVVLADKDGQFDLDGATLSPDDFRSALRYMQEQNQGPKSVLLKRGEKQKVTDRHLAELARTSMELHLRTYVQEKEGGQVQEVQAAEATENK